MLVASLLGENFDYIGLTFGTGRVASYLRLSLMDPLLPVSSRSFILQ